MKSLENSPSINQSAELLKELDIIIKKLELLGFKITSNIDDTEFWESV